LFIFIPEFLKISVDLQTAFAAETRRAEGATEQGKVMYVPSRNMNADYFEGRGATFRAAKVIY
jgi:hypothetical protein